MNSLLHELMSFEPISLSNMESVKLLNRVDTKFIINRQRLNFILESLMEDYYILDVDGCRNSRYKTLYFDTPTFDLYPQHHNGKLNRYKIRLRRYEESDLNFFEIKFKSNKKRTIKERIKRKKFETEIQGKSLDFLLDHNFLSMDKPILPVIYVYYSRITLVGKNSNERLTIDTDLSYEFDNKQEKYQNLAIIELKQDRSVASPAMQLLQQSHIHPFSISKYCLGILSLYDSVKKNNFKSKIQTIKRLCNENL